MWNHDHFYLHDLLLMNETKLLDKCHTRRVSFQKLKKKSWAYLPMLLFFFLMQKITIKLSVECIKGNLWSIIVYVKENELYSNKFRIITKSYFHCFRTNITYVYWLFFSIMNYCRQVPIHLTLSQWYNFEIIRFTKFLPILEKKEGCSPCQCDGEM